MLTPKVTYVGLAHTKVQAASLVATVAVKRRAYVPTRPIVSIGKHGYPEVSGGGAGRWATDNARRWRNGGVCE